MSADNLTAKSRAFYERTRSKMAASLLLIGMGLMALGWCSAFGGQSDSARHERTNASGDAEKALQSLVGGFGFACFCFFAAFAIFMAGSFYISPVIGSAAEKSMVNNNPHELRENVFDNFVANPIVHGDQTPKPKSPLRTHARVLTEEDEA